MGRRERERERGRRKRTKYILEEHKRTEEGWREIERRRER